MRIEVRPKLLLPGLRRGDFLGQKFHLLPHPPAYHDVVEVKSQILPGPVEHLVPDVVLDQPLLLLLAWRSLPGTREPISQVGQAGGGNDDGLLGFRAALADETVKREQHSSKREELQQ